MVVPLRDPASSPSNSRELRKVKKINPSRPRPPFSLGITPPKSQAQQCQRIPHAQRKCLTTLLLGHTDGPATTARRLGVLTTHTEAPVVTETTVRPDLLQALEVFTELRVDAVGKDLRVLAIDNVALTVKEPLSPTVSFSVLAYTVK